MVLWNFRKIAFSIYGMLIPNDLFLFNFSVHFDNPRFERSDLYFVLLYGLTFNSVEILRGLRNTALINQVTHPWIAIIFKRELTQRNPQ